VAKVVPIDSPSPASGSVTVLAVDALLIGPVTRWEISTPVEHLDPEGVTPVSRMRRGIYGGRAAIRFLT